MSDDWFNSNEEQEEEDEIIETKQHDFEFNMDVSEEKSVYVVTIAGNKGEGKTYTALSFIGSDKNMLALQFDDKVSPIKKYFYKNTDRIIVYNGKKHYKTDPSLITESGYKSIKYIEYILEQYAMKNSSDRPDFVLVDGLEILSSIAEMAMRYSNKLKPFSGIKNRNVWKERRGYLKGVHDLAVKVAKKGVIYTVYMDQVDTKIIEGEVQARHTEPKYVDAIKYETDIVLRAFQGEKDGEQVYGVEVVSSKYPEILVSGKRYNVTNLPLMIGLNKGKTQEVKKEVKKAKIKEDTKPEKSDEKPIQKPKKEEKQKPAKPVEKPEQKEKTSKGHVESETLEDPGDKHTQMLNELADQQKELDQKTDVMNKTLVEKTINKGKQLILESINDDFNYNEPILIKELRQKVLDTEEITQKAFKLSLEKLLEDDKLFEPRLGYVQLLKDEDEEHDIDAIEAADEMDNDEDDVKSEEENDHDGDFEMW